MRSVSFHGCFAEDSEGEAKEGAEEEEGERDAEGEGSEEEEEEEEEEEGEENFFNLLLVKMLTFSVASDKAVR